MAKSTGEECGNQALPSSIVCSDHGGMGMDAVPATHARYAKLPKRLRERYEFWTTQLCQVELRDQIALATVLEEDAVGLLDGEGLAGVAIKEVLRGIMTAVGELDEGKFDDAVETLNSAAEFLQDQQRAKEVKEEVMKIQEHLRRMKETEVKRMVAANQVLTVTESYNLIRRLVTVIEDYVDDENIRNRAIRELSSLLERRGYVPPPKI